jgi:molecular chaperone GrpE (heat shock protein)
MQTTDKEQQLEREWRARVSTALDDLRTGQLNLATEMSTLREQNSKEHAETKGRIDTMAAGMQKALDDANKALESRDKLVRVLVGIIIFLVGLTAGVKATASGLLKAIGFGA